MSNNFWHPKLEKCGFILEDGTVVECENTSPNPERGFQIDQAEIDKYNNISVFWHSHPSDDLNLSLEDYFNFLKYPEQRHRIYGSTEYAEYFVRRNFVMREENDFTIS